MSEDAVVEWEKAKGWEISENTPVAQHQVDFQIKTQTPKPQPREFAVPRMWNWSECNYFTPLAPFDFELNIN